MEKGLRDLIAKKSHEEFRGVYVESGLSPTRKNVLAPGAVGVYAAGSNYNPAQVTRDAAVVEWTSKIDRKLADVPNKGVKEISIEEIEELVCLTRPDQNASEYVWNSVAVVSSLVQLKTLRRHRTGFVYVDRDRRLEESRRETQGILTGGEYDSVPSDRLALFMLRTKAGNGKNASWWPQVRFPDGPYAFAFAV
jgi:hypothetical protein